MERRAVSEIFVIPPATRVDEIQPSDLKAYLERFFPRYTFIVSDTLPFQDDDDFVLIPVAGIAGDGPNTGMFKQVPKMEWAQIRDALRSYPARHSRLN